MSEFLIEVEVLARVLMDEHGLADWKIQWSKARRELGHCDHEKRTIFISEPYALCNSIGRMKETILHEIAHALVDEGHGHDEVWRAKAKEIGVQYLRPYSKENREPIVHPKVPKRKWFVGVCPNKRCGRRIFRHSRRKQSCGRCFPDGYHPKFAFRWRRPSRMERYSLEEEAR